jgi:hypothetical protein
MKLNMDFWNAGEGLGMARWARDGLGMVLGRGEDVLALLLAGLGFGVGVPSVAAVLAALGGGAAALGTVARFLKFWCEGMGPGRRGFQGEVWGVWEEVRMERDLEGYREYDEEEQGKKKREEENEKWEELDLESIGREIATMEQIQREMQDLEGRISEAMLAVRCEDEDEAGWEVVQDEVVREAVVAQDAEMKRVARMGEDIAAAYRQEDEEEQWEIVEPPERDGVWDTHDPDPGSGSMASMVTPNFTLAGLDMDAWAEAEAEDEDEDEGVEVDGFVVVEEDGFKGLYEQPWAA